MRTQCASLTRNDANLHSRTKDQYASEGTAHGETRWMSRTARRFINQGSRRLKRVSKSFWGDLAFLVRPQAPFEGELSALEY